MIAMSIFSKNDVNLLSLSYFSNYTKKFIELLFITLFSKAAPVNTKFII